MFCPGCASQVGDDLKYCRQCGTNLRGVREAITSPPPDVTPDWGWAAYFKHAHEVKERMRGTPEERRINEIKGGVISSLGSIGLMVFLYFFLDIVANYKSPDEGWIRSLWLFGIIPMLIGLGVLFNGLVVSRRLIKLKEQEMRSANQASFIPAGTPSADQSYLQAKTTDQLSLASSSAEHSVTDETTRLLSE